jgi:predicted AlkP superfamily phosphohydrolase/phosphomutase
MHPTNLLKTATLLLLALNATPVAHGLSDPERSDGRVIVLGIDGGDYETVRELIDAGRLPNLAKLAESGTFAPLTSTISPESPTAWAALNTGRNPSETGVPGFVKRTFREVGGQFVPMPDIGHQISGDRPMSDFKPGGILGVIQGMGGNKLMSVFGVIAALVFFFVLKILLKLGALPSGFIALFMGAVGAFSANTVARFVPETIPSVVSNPMRAEPFWEIAAREGERCVVLDAAMAWDREPVEGARVLAGLGVPDIRGANGEWFIYTTDDFAFERPPKGKKKGLTAGTIFRVDWNGDKIETELYGPLNPHAAKAIEAEVAEIEENLGDPGLGWKEGSALRDRQKRLKEELSIGPRATLPLSVKRIDESLRVTLGSETQMLQEGDWSDWYRLTFELNPLVKAHAVTRVKLVSVDEPHFELFVNTLDIDPSNPPFWQPVSQPAGFSKELADWLGEPFETFGWACVTMPFKDGKIGGETLMEDIEFTLGWRERLTEEVLKRDDWDVLFSVFSTPDRVQHMMYQFYDPDHPMYDAEAAATKIQFAGKEITFADTIPAIYEEIDRVVGEVVADHLRPEDTLLICADHGFQTFRWQFHVNNWLEQEGYLVMKEGVSSGMKSALMYVDWEKTRAYSLGLGMIYLNLEGREPTGIVKVVDGPDLIAEIKGKLLEATDPKNGAKVIEEVHVIDELHQGEYRDREGDLIPGFAPTYRVSWGTTMGDIKLKKDDSGAWISAPIIEANEMNWSGGHVSVALSRVTGTFFSNRQVEVPAEGAHLLDIAPTVLSLKGVPIPAEMDHPPLEFKD